MTLPSSGTITTAQIAAEIGVSSLTFPAANTLWLAGKAAAPIVIPTDYYGKTWGPTITNMTTQTERFGAVSSPGSQWTLPSGSPFAVGDLVIVTQLAESSDATPPASVVPSGWTQIGSSLTVVTDAGTGARMNTSYRILTAGQVGATFTGMNGTAKNRVCGRQYHFDRALASVTVVDQSASLSAGDPTNLTSNWDSVRDASHLYIGHAHAELTISDVEFAWSTAADAPLGSDSETRTWSKLYANTAPVSSITMTTGDNGTFNGLFSALLRVK